MTRFLLSLLAGVAACIAPTKVPAFTLVGEIPTWFVTTTGLAPGDVYGPVNLGEEYRWVVPEIIYGFDESFLNYFGQRGVEEIEKAIQVFNDLPPMSELNVDDFPTFSMRVNHRARELALFDLKSFAMQMICEQLGLGTPGRFVFTLRRRDLPNQATNYLVVMRNFDPVTWEPTPYINGQLWTYFSIFDNTDSDPNASTIPEPVDPLLLAEPVAAGTSIFNPTLFGIGSYYTGLTRDDVGGLRYIYRPDNRNVETLPADAIGQAGFIGGGGGGAWTPIINQPNTNVAGGDTNAIAFYPQGIRGGINKIRFTRLGDVYQAGAYAATNRFVDEARVIITNGVERVISQRVVRLLAAPDILFTAADLTAPFSTIVYAERTDIAINNDAINGAETLDGPGQFNGPGQVTFNKTGPGSLFNAQPTTLSEALGTPYAYWGSFDGSTNEPVAYPSGTSIRELEARIFGGQ